MFVFKAVVYRGAWENHIFQSSAFLPVLSITEEGETG